MFFALFCFPEITLLLIAILTSLGGLSVPCAHPGTQITSCLDSDSPFRGAWITLITEWQVLITFQVGISTSLLPNSPQFPLNNRCGCGKLTCSSAQGWRTSQRLGQSNPVTTMTGSGLGMWPSSSNQGKSLVLGKNTGTNRLNYSSWMRIRKHIDSCGSTGSRLGFMRRIKLG